MTDKKNRQKHFIETTTKTIDDFGMLKENDTVLAAVSGGPDSVALVLSLLALKKKYDIKISLAHLNHKLRGEEALRDEIFVKGLAKRLALPFHEGRKDIKAYAKDQQKPDDLQDMKQVLPKNILDGIREKLNPKIKERKEKKTKAK